MLRRIFIRLSAIVICISLILFTGCEESEVASPDKDKSFLENTSGNVTVVLYFPDLPGSETDSKVLDELSARAYKALNINLMFKKSEATSTDTYEKSAYPFESNMKFDAAVIYCDYTLLAQKGYLMDLTNLLPKHAPFLYSSYSTEQIMQSSFDNKIYAVPPLSQGSQRLCAVIRNDLVSKYNVSDLDTLDEYEHFLAHIKGNEHNAPIARMHYDDWRLIPQAYGYSVMEGYLVYKTDDPLMKLYPWEQTTEYRTAFDLMNRLIDSGMVFSRDDITKTDMSSLGSFLTSWNAAQSFVRFTDSNFTVFLLYKSQKAPRTFSPVPCIVVNSKSQHPEQVLRFLDWIHSDQDIYDLLMYGLEGTHYTLTGERVSLKPGMASYYSWKGSKAFANDNMSRELTSDPEGFNDKLAHEISNTEYPPHSGFAPQFDTAILSTIERRNRMLPEYVVMDHSDKIDPSRPTIYDVMIELEKVLNVEKFRDEAQKQLDSWIRSR